MDILLKEIPLVGNYYQQVLSKFLCRFEKREEIEINSGKLNVMTTFAGRVIGFRFEYSHNNIDVTLTFSQHPADESKYADFIMSAELFLNRYAEASFKNYASVSPHRYYADLYGLIIALQERFPDLKEVKCY